MLPCRTLQIIWMVENDAFSRRCRVEIKQIWSSETHCIKSCRKKFQVSSYFN